MGSSDPPAVQAAPWQGQVINPQWRVELRDGRRPITVTGDLRWADPPTRVQSEAGSMALAGRRRCLPARHCGHRSAPAHIVSADVCLGHSTNRYAGQTQAVVNLTAREHGGVPQLAVRPTDESNDGTAKEKRRCGVYA
jgi:hypothetical protein